MLIIDVKIPNTILSKVVNFGARFWWRDNVISCFRSTIFSAAIERKPPGLNNRSQTAIKLDINASSLIMRAIILKNERKILRKLPG